MLAEALARRALTTYLEIAEASYRDSVLAAEKLAEHIDALLRAPSAETLDAARAAWLLARRPYAQTEVFRFYDGPIDQVELWVNTWPIDEGYVESEAGAAALGIVQDVARYPQLSIDLLAQLNGHDGETAISTGYHVIEFLLWGRDQNASGPGQRSYQDYQVRQGKQRDLSAERRAEYLRLATQLLLRQLRQVQTSFGADDAHGYRAQFLAAPVAHGLYRALRGMAKLSGPELSGERLTVAYETKNQENEHSCFSDSTQADLAGNALGIENVCLGRYQRSDGSRLTGPGICMVLEEALPTLGAALTRQISQSRELVAAIPAPFDRAILGADDAPGRQAIQRAIVSLRKQSEWLEQARMKLTLPDPSPLSLVVQ